MRGLIGGLIRGLIRVLIGQTESLEAWRLEKLPTNKDEQLCLFLALRTGSAPLGEETVRLHMSS